MPASNGWRSNTRSSSRLESRVRDDFHRDARFLADQTRKSSLTLLSNHRRQHLIRMEDVAIAHVVGNVQRCYEAKYIRQHQRERERAADPCRDDERDERPGERGKEPTEEKYRHDIR